MSPSLFDLSANEILERLDPAAPLMPELEAARQNLSALKDSPQVQKTLAWTEALVGKIAEIPQTRYTDYRLYIRTGDRRSYENPYFARRAMLAGAALRLFLGESQWKDPLQDLIWAICEESNWVLPAHERTPIDLFSAETAFMLGETLALLGDRLDAEVRSRVRFEVERRVFQPYLVTHDAHWWFQGHNNWNGVCNSSVAAAFLLLEPEPGRVAAALALAFRGLRTFFETAFEVDGSSTEGVGYWQYGLLNFVALAEMLRARSHGAIDLLDSEQMRKIAAYPAKMMLSPARFATFSDCDDALNFNPGMVARLMERTGEQSLQGLLSRPVPSERQWRLTMMLRDMLWWDGQYRQVMPAADAYLPVGGIARLLAKTPGGTQLALAIKAGHNDENHNQNDVGSWILHVDEESFLVDPGRGLYSRQYFGPERYKNIFTNSYGHSVPVIAGELQKEGREYRGALTVVDLEGPLKCVELELASAYPLETLSGLRRRVTLSTAGELELLDTIQFAGTPGTVQEAFLTWLEVEINGSQVVLHGAHHDVCLSITAPVGAVFALEKLDRASQENAKPAVLKRLSIDLPAALVHQVSVRAVVVL
jgi:hypothetical protein